MKFEFSPHIAFQVKDYKNAKEFYEMILGMEVVSTSETETHFKKGGMNFYMEAADTGLTFFEFKTEDVKAAREELENEGCKVTKVYSEKSMMFADPYGMRFHVWSD
ncbi:MAG: VOC family protein [Ignavibacteria bacterium]|jgi:predicted enzyme related to lactoylglutathione lyase|nr:VOC family protein [Ignavibacteria bacterium]